MTERTPPLLRQRLPFFLLLCAAVAGILAGRWLPFPSTVWLGVAGAAGILFFLRRAGFLVLVVAAFAALHLWQGRESASARLAQWIRGHSGPATVEGMVAGEARVFDAGSCSFYLRLTRLEAGGITVAPPVTILAEWPGPPPTYGDRVRLTGMLENLPPPRNPGQFNFAAWSALRGVHSRIRTRDVRDGALLGGNAGNPLQKAADAARLWMKDTLIRGVNDPPVADLLIAMVLGETSSLPEPIQEQFRGTGTYHLFSVSGLHVGMLAVLLWTLLRVFRVSRRQAALVIIPAVLFYAFMTGWKPASVRAALMTSVVLCGLIAKRQPVLFNTLCAAAFLILLGDTNQLFNAGFQLSFCVVAAIFLLARPLTDRIEKPFAVDPFLPEKLLTPARRALHNGWKTFAGLAGVSAAAWTGSLPLTLGYFHLISFSALPANLLAVPISFGIMAVAMLSLLGGMVWPWVSLVFNQTNWLLTHLLMGTVGICASLPGSFVYFGLPRHPAPDAEIVVFDFGAGGATWIAAGGRGWLLDCGPVATLDSTLLPFLRAQGRQTLNGLILTHGDARHLGAAAALLKSCPPGQVIDSVLADRSPHRRRIQSLLSEQGHPKSLHRAGDVLSLAPGVSLHFLYPPAGRVSAVADDKAFVTRLDVGETRILFQSDAGFPTEQWLLKHAREALRCDILVRGRPRSGPSGDAAFLEAASPRVLVATAAPFPESEVLPPEFSQLLARRGIRLFRQDHTGAVTIRIFSTRWEVAAFLTPQQYFHYR